MPEMTDAQAKQLLALLKLYFRAYPAEDQVEMTCWELMEDLRQSLA